LVCHYVKYWLNGANVTTHFPWISVKDALVILETPESQGKNKRKMNVVRSLLDDMKTKQLQWCGHVQRMEEGRVPKEVTKWSPPG